MVKPPGYFVFVKLKKYNIIRGKRQGGIPQGVKAK